MTIEAGQKIPSVTIKLAGAAGAKDIDVAEFFAGKNVVMFSLPGAFTPTCSKQHLPGFVARADEMHKKGVDIIACLSVNDAFVMQEWANAHNVGDKIAMLADGNATFSKALGIDVDLSVAGMGTRARRGVITVKNGVVTSVELEAPGKLDVSSADACMLKLG